MYIYNTASLSLVGQPLHKRGMVYEHDRTTIEIQTRRRHIKLKVVYNIINKLSRIPPTVFVNHPSPPLDTLTIKYSLPTLRLYPPSLSLLFYQCYPYLEFCLHSLLTAPPPTFLNHASVTLYHIFNSCCHFCTPPILKGWSPQCALCFHL